MRLVCTPIQLNLPAPRKRGTEKVNLKDIPPEIFSDMISMIADDFKDDQTFTVDNSFQRQGLAKMAKLRLVSRRFNLEVRWHLYRVINLDFNYTNRFPTW